VVGLGVGLGVAEGELELLGFALGVTDGDFVAVGVTEGFAEEVGAGEFVAVGLPEAVARAELDGVGVAEGFAVSVGLGFGLPVASAGVSTAIGISNPSARHALLMVRFMTDYFQLRKFDFSRPFHFSQGNLLI